VDPVQGTAGFKRFPHRVDSGDDSIAPGERIAHVVIDGNPPGVGSIQEGKPEERLGETFLGRNG
jgi:hypothetical protein